MASEGFWRWVNDLGNSCGFNNSSSAPLWVRTDLTQPNEEIPGLPQDILSRIRVSGGNLEEKLQLVANAFQWTARSKEGLQVTFRKKALENKDLPPEVQEVIASGSYSDAFLQAFDEQSFTLFEDEVVPYHQYRLLLEVHTGGPYWSGIATQGMSTIRHQAPVVGASSPIEGSGSVLGQYGAGQRGAVFVWRWMHLLDTGPYPLPEWLERILSNEGADPLRKMLAELEAVRRWEVQVKDQTAKYIKQGAEIQDLYIKEVLKLWPCEPDPKGGEQLKNNAWIEGLDAELFVGRTVIVDRVKYDDLHCLVLQATISQRQVAQAQKDKQPPYRLITQWLWTAPKGITGAKSSKAENDPSVDKVNLEVPHSSQENCFPGGAFPPAAPPVSTLTSMSSVTRTMAPGSPYGPPQPSSSPPTSIILPSGSPYAQTRTVASPSAPITMPSGPTPGMGSDRSAPPGAVARPTSSHSLTLVQVPVTSAAGIFRAPSLQGELSPVGRATLAPSMALVSNHTMGAPVHFIQR